MSNSLLTSYFLIVFTCNDPSLTSCEITEIGPLEERKCAALATHIGETARKLELKETVIFYCTEDIDSIKTLPFEQTKEATIHD